MNDLKNTHIRLNTVLLDYIAVTLKTVRYHTVFNATQKYIILSAVEADAINAVTQHIHSCGQAGNDSDNDIVVD